jgi:hypothetical protein
MSSLIHYRFKAGMGEWSRLAFDGHALPLYEVKKLITTAKKLNPADQEASSGRAGGEGKTLQDFELILTNLSARENTLEATAFAGRLSRACLT